MKKNLQRILCQSVVGVFYIVTKGAKKAVIKKIMRSTILKNTSYSLAGKIIAMLFLALLDVLAARMLSIEGYAEWVFFFAILTMLFYVGWLGINASAKVYVSKGSNERDRDNCLRASLTLRFIASIAICMVIFLIVPGFAGYLGYPDKYTHLEILLEMAVVLVFFNSFTEFFKEVFIGLQSYKLLFAFTTCEYIGYFLFSAIFLSITRNVQAITFGYAVSGACMLILGFYFLNQKIGYQHKNTDFHYKEYIVPIVKYAIPIMVISFGGMILVEMDTFMLGLLSDKVEVAAYSIAKNLCSKAAHINYALTVGTMTTFSVLTADNIKEKTQQFKKIDMANIVITAGISLGMLIFSTIAITLIYGVEYLLSGIVMRYLVPYYALYSISNFYSMFLDFRGKAHFRSICYISIIVVNLILNYLMIPKYGAKGAALATDISIVPYTIMVAGGTFLEFYRWRKYRC